MNTFDRHNQAMDLAEQGFTMIDSNPMEAIDLFKLAYAIEKEIADLIEPVKENEPSRSIFYKSAASLALNAKLYREAEISACLGLIGYPDEFNGNELRDILDQSNFERHLELNDVDLKNNQFQLSFVGNEVGIGYIKSNELVDRLEIITDVARKEVEKRANKKFNTKGRPGKTIQMYPLYVSAGMTGSYKVVIQIGTTKNNEPLIGGKYDIEKEIIKSIITGVQLINDNNLSELERRYGENDPYYDFFVASMKSFAPDGNRIKMIGFTSNIDGEEIKTQFVRPRHEIGKLKELDTEGLGEASEEGTIIVVEGVLDLSKSRKSTHVFEVMDDDRDKPYKFELSEGELASVVRDNYKDLVRVKGKRKKGKREIYTFIDIENIE